MEESELSAISDQPFSWSVSQPLAISYQLSASMMGEAGDHDTWLTD
jgi:hypothetical protein